MYLANGSSGSDVKKLQELLNSHGAGLAVDGIFGSATEQAVKNYQSANGLGVDGIVGEQTWGSLTGSGGGSSQGSAQGSAQGGYQQSDSVKQAYALLNQHIATKPGDFSWAQQGELDAAIDQWRNREDFVYDVASDPLYQMYKQQYSALGKLAMEDAMGQAAAMTGGYSNSYAEAVAQQTYNNYMQQVSGMLPEFYTMARQQYNEAGQQMLDEISLLNNLRSTAYGEYSDQYNNWYNWLDYLANSAQYAEESEYERYRDAIEDERYEREWERQLAIDEIENTGDVEESGLTQELMDSVLSMTDINQAEAYLQTLINRGDITEDDAYILLDLFVHEDPHPESFDYWEY